MDEEELTALHEAAHVVALLAKGCSVTRVCINDNSSGEAKTPSLPDGDEDLLLVGLVGMQAERHFAGDAMTFDEFALAYSSASGDRDVIEEETRGTWLAHNANWRTVRYNKAEVFIQNHEQQIRAVADAILAKPSFPKCLTEVEINQILNV